MPSISIKDLYYTKEFLESGFSDTPSSLLEPSRLLEGRPAFKNSARSETLIKKKIILPCLKRLDWTAVQIKAAEEKLKLLRDIGFEIYFMEDGKLTALAENEILRATSESIKSPEEISRILNIPVDEFIIIADDDYFDEFLTRSFEKFEDFAPYHFIDMYIVAYFKQSPSILHDLFLQSADKIESLIYVTSTAHYLNLNTVSFSKLKLLDASYGEYKAEDLEVLRCLLTQAQNLEKLKLRNSIIDLRSLRALLNGVPALEELDIAHCKNLSEGDLSGLNLPFLKKLTLSHSNINSKALNDLLSNASLLEELDLAHCKNLSEGDLSGLNLPFLKKLTLNDSNINLNSLSALLNNASLLESLDLFSCENLSEGELPDLNLPSLKMLVLSASSINLNTLKALLNNTPQLEALELAYCMNLSVGNLSGLNLPSLKRLNLGASLINLQALHALLCNASLLEELDLEFCKNLLEGELSDLNLASLKSLKLSQSTINVKTLNTLLSNAPQLVGLTLCECIPLSIGELSDCTLSSLKSLMLDGFSTNLSTLNALLRNTPQLEELYLSRCQYLSESALPDWNLAFLKKLMLNSSTINFETLKALLKKTPQLEYLDLTNCRNLVAKDLTSLLAGMQKLNQYIPPSSSFYIHKYFNHPVAAQAPLLEEKHAVTRDADTTNRSEKTLQTTQYFIGHPHTPHVRDYRLHAYDKLELNSGSVSEQNPFIFSHNDLMTDLDLSTLGSIKRYPNPLKEVFEKQDSSGDEYYLGRFNLKISDTWRPLPSLHAIEELLFYYMKEAVPVAIKKNPRDGFYYIKSTGAEQAIQMEVLLKKPRAVPGVSYLPVKIQELVRFCQGFRKGPLLMPPGNQTAAAYMEALKTQRVGACRHRVVVFQSIMKECWPEIPVQIIENECHAFSEVFYNEHWVSCDLGGYDVPNLKINQSNFSDSLNYSSTPPVIESPSLSSQALPASISPLVQTKTAPKLRRIPESRFYLKENRLGLHQILKSEGISCLVATPEPCALAYALQYIAEHTQQPYFYIDNPSQLACSKPYIEQVGLRGIIKKGPGGALYDFIQTHPDGVILIDYSAFKPADIVKFNSILDTSPSVDGVPLSRHKVIGLLNPEAPGTYQGADLYSRFCNTYEIDVAINPLPEPRRVTQALQPDSDTLSFDLMGGENWEALLLGHWEIKGHALIRHQGVLVDELSKNPHTKRLVFTNPPQKNPEFNRFLQDMALHRGVFLQGKRRHVFAGRPPELCLFHSVAGYQAINELNWSQEEVLPAQALALNPETLSALLGCYEATEKNELYLKPGLIEAFSGPTIPLYVTGNLSVYQWQKLVKKAQEHRKELLFYAAFGVSLPEGVHAISSKWAWPTSATRVEINLPQTQETDLVIDVSEVEPVDLLPSVKAVFDEKTLHFSFTPKAGFLETQLAAGKKIILYGDWKSELARALHPLLLQRRQGKALGELILVDPTKSRAFPFIQEQAINPLPIIPRIAPRKVTYAQRLDAVEEALQDHPFVFLAGATGVGKTYFINQEWAKKHTACYYGEGALFEWAHHQPSPGEEWVSLFIDEANIIGRQWSEFQGLFQRPPALFHQGYIVLSPKHRVIFAGNPLTYGGERTLPRLFQEPHPVIEFTTLSLNELVAPFAPVIQEVVRYVSSKYPNELYLTPRECLMMEALGQTSGHPEVFAYELARAHLPQTEHKAFDTRFKPETSIVLDLPKLSDFELTKDMRPAAQSLIAHLTLRSQRLAGVPLPKGGLGGLVLEGEPGMGKSELIIQMLMSLRLKPTKDFYHIPVSLGVEEKTKKLLEAFHEGKIVIIDEINSSPMLERLMNALLEGHDLENKSGKKGFILLGTQNPISFQGRKATPKPVEHRLQTVKMSLSQEGMMQVLTNKYHLPPRIASDMLEEYRTHQRKNSKLCFRDLQRWAKKWAEANLNQAPLQLLVEPANQVGSECTLTALATVENYFAQLAKRTPIPLHKRGRKIDASIRQLAKQGGSVQGEVLEMRQLKELAEKNLGYATECVVFKNDFHLFFNTTIDQLRQGHLPLIFFAVEEDSGQPDPDPREPEAREHAAVITGYNRKIDEFTLAHWGATYTVDAVTLFNSSNALVQTRTMEYYSKKPHRTPGDKEFTPKYLPSTTPTALKSIDPKTSGFAGQLFIIKKPEDLLDLSKVRASAKGMFFSSTKRSDQDAQTESTYKPTK